jgi:lipoprotein-anchoring transpeptidase ErfK/SrfK
MVKGRGASFDAAAQALKARWTSDIEAGVPATAISPLEAELAGYQKPGALSTGWWSNQPAAEIRHLQDQSAAAWQVAMGAARKTMDGVVGQGEVLVDTATGQMATAWKSDVTGWVVAEQKAGTPAALVRMATDDLALIAAEKQKIAVAKQLEAAGGIGGLTSQVASLDGVARQDNLDAGEIDAAFARLQRENGAGALADDAITGVLTAIGRFQGMVVINNAVAGAMRPLLLELDEASLVGTPSAGALQVQYGALGPQFQAARTFDQLTAAQALQKQIKATADAELAAGACGHGGPGKQIVVSLSLQELVAYQDGCVVQATPVTTGRPQLPTPAGSFAVFYKTSPFQMVSPWPKGSPFYYRPDYVTWVLEFHSGGYFLHDAVWEAPGSYGPGGEYDINAASHGCIHVPTPVMQWLYGWTPVGTPVTVVP